ncbi:MAG: hypothetical protein EOR93_27285 [Mesorhizobium sp.]|nr:MAG: hypothetical protein EOR93_27285 [Mesorhizobium sp.]
MVMFAVFLTSTWPPAPPAPPWPPTATAAKAPPAPAKPPSPPEPPTDCAKMPIERSLSVAIRAVFST